MNRIFPTAALCFAAIVSGCATLSESECETADWRAIGVEDGAKGQLVTYLGRHRKACAEYGVTPDLARYQRGHAEGLTHFCTARKGYQYGNSGRVYNGVCPDELSGEFLPAYENGRTVFLSREELRRMENELRTARADLQELIEQIEGLEAALVAGGGTPARRQAWIDELKDLQYDRDQLEGQVHDRQHAVELQEDEYRALSSRYQY